ncbi:MAG: hypothetical protein ABL952_14410, partial [Pyrinomonadaceae bacterium]
MKICPRCQKTYSDDNLNFCLEDGSVLTQAAAEPPQSPPPQVAERPAQKPKPLPPTLVARIELKTQTMTVQAGARIVHTWKVSSGA